MRKVFTFCLFFIALIAASQAPQVINYQAIARNASGNIVTTAIGVKFQIYQGSVGGTLVYEETHTATPSAVGIFTVGIGAGTPVTGTFNSISWGTNTYFLQVNIDPAGGTSYSTVGANQLVSVPYALYAEKAGNAVSYNAGTGIAINSGSIINSAPDQTVNVSAAGIATVTNAYPNFSVNVGAPSLNYNSGTKELTLSQGGTNTTATLTGTGSNTISLTGTGIANVSPTGAGSNFTVNVASPVIIGQGATTVLGTWPNFTVTSSNTNYTAGTGISIAGSVISNTAPNQTVNIAGAGMTTVSGSYPNYTINTPTIAPPPLPVIVGNGIATVASAANNYTVNVPPVGMNYIPSTGVLTYSPAPGNTTLNISPALTFTNGTLGVGSNTVNIPGVGLWSRPTATATILSNPGDFVGIGINSPGTKLHLHDSSAATSLTNFSGSPKTSIRIHNYNTTNNNFSSLIFSTINSGSGNYESSKIVGVHTNHTTGSMTGDLAFLTRNPGNINERMRLTSSGYLGLGTVSPQQIMHVYSSGTNVGLVIEAATAGRARLGLLAGGLDNGEIGYTNHLTFGTIANSSLVMSNEWMRITNTGNVGIGITTPSNKFAVGNSGIEKLNISGATGGINLLDDQGSITFPATTAAAKPMIQMFASGTANPTRMVISHSSAFPNYGLQYDDVNDRFNIIGNGNQILTADLGTLRVGIGTYTPQALLEVAGEERISGAGGKIYFKDQITVNPFYYTAYVTGGAFHIQYGAAASNFYLNGANCYVGTGFMGAGTRLTVGTSGDGSNAIANAWSVFSDRRFKENIEILKDPISIVNALQGVTYTWRKTGRKDIGFIAQDVEEVLPAIVFTDEESGYKSVDYSRMTSVLIEAVKEQQKMIEELKKRQSELENEVKQLKNK